MKFAKHLEGNLVIEWKSQYFDYKRAKKLLHRLQSERESIPDDQPDDGESHSDVVNADSAGLQFDEHRSDTAESIKNDSRDEPEPSTGNGGSGGHGPPALRQRRRGRSMLSNQNFRSLQLQTERPAQREFLDFVDAELRKIETFYVDKQYEIFTRMREIELHLDELQTRRPARIRRQVQKTGFTYRVKTYFEDHWLQTKAALHSAFSLNYDPFAPHSVQADSVRSTMPQYKRARRRIEQAVFENYHEMEYLHSYRILNYRAFVKIMKKFDKTADTAVKDSFMRTEVDVGPLGSATDLEEAMSHTEHLYAQHFEYGNKKNALARLRSPEVQKDYIWVMSRVGVLIGASIPLLLEGIVCSFTIFSPTRRSFLLQIWAGFFLILLFLLLFGLNCFVWTKFRVNYQFIFQTEPRNNLSYEEFFEIPALLLFIFSLLFWMCFRGFFEDFSVYYPAVFLATAMFIAANPLPLGYSSSRRWFLWANAKLLFSGLANVHFQDFFLGDQYNSLAYSISNIELFFCLYACKWTNAGRCTSSQSMLMGFFSTLPAIWRFLQCVRRYMETRNKFPHLANCGKYACTILYYMFLSFWRRNGAKSAWKIVFIVFATVNSVYATTWDLVMDWSLFQAKPKYPFLRKNMVYPAPWPYYAAMFLDPVLRFAWIFYAIYPDRIQHAADTSFFIGLAEVFRRFIWNFFRVENEEIYNRQHLKVAHQINLPFSNIARPPSEAPAAPSSSSTSVRENISNRHREDFTVKPSIDYVGRDGAAEDYDDDDDDDDDDFYIDRSAHRADNNRTSGSAQGDS